VPKSKNLDVLLALGMLDVSQHLVEIVPMSPSIDRADVLPYCLGDDLAMRCSLDSDTDQEKKHNRWVDLHWKPSRCGTHSPHEHLENRSTYGHGLMQGGFLGDFM